MENNKEYALRSIAERAVADILYSDNPYTDNAEAVKSRIAVFVDTFAKENPQSPLGLSHASGERDALLAAAWEVASKHVGVGDKEPSPKKSVRPDAIGSELSSKVSELLASMSLIEKRKWLLLMLMDKNGITAADIARRHGFSRWHIAGAVCGRHGWSPRVIRAFESELGVTLGQYMTPAEDRRGRGDK